MQRSAEKTDYTPEAPQHTEETPTAKPTAAKKVYEKVGTTLFKDLTDEFMEKVSFTTLPRTEPGVKVKTHLLIHKPKPKGGKNDTESLVIGLPSGYVSVRVNESKFGKKRTMRYSWIDPNHIKQVDAYYNTIFRMMLDHTMDEYIPNFVPTSIKVKVDGEEYTYDTYHDLLEKIDKEKKDRKKSKKASDVSIEDLEELAEKVSTLIRTEIWKICRINRVIGLSDNEAVRSKYIELSTYPSKKSDHIDEAEYERRQRDGNIRRPVFFGAELLSSKPEKKIQKQHILSNFCCPADKPRDGRVIYQVPKSGNGYFFYDKDMTVNPTYDGKQHCYKCGLDLKQSHFYLSISDSGEMSIVLQEEYIGCEFYNFVVLPDQLKATKDTSRERESEADDNATPMEANSSVTRDDGLGIKSSALENDESDYKPADGDDEGTDAGDGYTSA